MKVDKLLILDLDETLIHAHSDRPAYQVDFSIEGYHISKRPGLDQFLQDCSAHFSLGVWSSAGDQYVEAIVNSILPAGTELLFCWGRSRCTLKRNMDTDDYYFEKKLVKLKNKGYTLNKIIIVDDSPEKLQSNYGNAVYIKPFTGNREDIELKHLFDYLLTLKDADNIRAIEKRNWRKYIDDL